MAVGSDPISALRQAVHAEDGRLTDSAYRATAHLFAETQRDPGLLESFGAEYGRVEALLCVDRTGSPVPISDAALADYRQTVAASPDFGLWFRRASLPNGRPALLIARWLCHIAGLRHRTVHLFLDHPTLSDHTVLQLRGLDKAEAPGLIDLPAAGHVVGMETVEEALQKEVDEELDLSLDSLESLACLGSYAYEDTGGTNAEYRTIYRGRLSREAWMRLGAGDDELLAIAFLPLSKLRALVTAHPERVASGLSASLALYERTRYRRGGG